MTAQSPATSSLAGSLLLGLLYFLAGLMGMLIIRVSGGDVGVLWYPLGLAILALLVFGRRMWPGIAVGVVALGLVAGQAPPAILIIAAGQIAAGLVGYTLLRAGVGRAVAGILLAPLIGAVFVLVGHGVGGAERIEVIAGRAAAGYVADLGALIVLLPFLFQWRAMRTPRTVFGEKKPRRSTALTEEESKSFGETIGGAISRSRDLRTGLQRCAEAMVEHLDLGLGRIWVLDANGETLNLFATAGIEQPAPQELTLVRVGQAAVGKVAAECAPYHTNSIPDDEFILCREWCAEQGLVSFAALPLLVEERLVGVVAMFARVALERPVLKALNSVADAIAVGIERKRVESDLERNQTYFAAVIEQADEGIAIVDHEGSHQLVNPAYCGLTGFSNDELLERTIYDLVAADARAEVSPLVTVSESARRVIGVVRRDGSRFTAEIGGSPLDIAGERLTLTTVRDITRELEGEDRHRRIEEQLRLSQRMESVGQLAGGVAHDFNNLLLVILGHVELAEGSIEEGKEGVIASLNEIQAAAERAAILTRQLLAFSRRQPLQFERLDLNELVQGMMKMLRRLTPESYELEFVPGEDPGRVSADPGQVEQVLLNLVINSRDALDETGEIGSVRIETARETVDSVMHAKFPWAIEGEYVMLSVHDTGVGMPPEVVEHVFDPFFTTKEMGHGTGMGLATVYGIVKQHNGLILCESERGVGTTFQVYLPLVAEGAAPEDSGAGTGPVRGNETILVAEDDDSVRKMVGGILRQVGYHVIEAEDGAEALLLFEENQDEIDLVLLDAVMPKLSGLDTYARISVLNPDVPVLFTSGYSPRRIPPELLEDDRLTLLLKPYGPADLLREVRQAIEN